MFSGIVEAAIEVVSIRQDEGNIHLTLRCPFADELRIDQSIAHNGVCLTVVSLPGDGTYTVTAIKETLDRSNLGDLKVGDLVNVERSMKIDGRLDGHIVQGHVDTTAICQGVETADGSWYYSFKYDVDRELAKKRIRHGRKRICDSERRKPDCVRLRERFIPSGHYPLYSRQHQLPSY